MDLFWALDGRFQAGTVEPDSIAPVARLLGADSIVLAGDTAAEKFDTPSPETTWSMFLAGAAGLGTPATYGVAIPNGRGAFLDVERIAGRDTGAPVPPVAIVPVEDPRPLVRATGASVIVAGSGDGLVDAAAAGLLPADAAVVYDASPGNPSLPGSDAVLLTDSARKRAHYWWGSQDVEGAVEPPTTTTVIDDPADSRLAVFPGVAPAQQTTMEIDGPFVARATGYGGPSSARPEDQPQYAIDGDPATAWRVADRADARGAVLRLESGTPQEFDTITIEQAESRTGGIPRHITEIELRTEDLRARVALDPGRTELALADSTSWVEIEIVQTDAGDRDQYAGYAPVGLAEVELGGVAPSPFGLRLPLLTDATATPDAVLVTRDRVDPLDRWRRDPETSLDRRWNSVAEARYEVRPTIRLSTATSPELVASILGIGDAATADTSLRGALDRSAWFAIDGDQSTAWSSDVGHTTGSSVTVRSIAGEVLDQLAVTTLVDSSHSLVRTLRIVSGGSERTVAIEGAGGRLPIEPLVLGDRTTFVVDASEDRIAIDRPSGAAVTLPVGITELGGHGLLNALVLDQFWSGCRSDLLAIDGSAVDVQVSGTVADALSPAARSRRPRVSIGPTYSFPPAPIASRRRRARSRGTTSIEWRWWDRAVVGRALPGAAWNGSNRERRTADRGDRSRSQQSLDHGDRLRIRLLGDRRRRVERRLDGLGRRQLARHTERGRRGSGGWWIPPGPDGERTVELTWTPQRWTWLALAVSLLGVIGCLAVIWRSRRSDAARTAPAAGDAVVGSPGLSLQELVLPALVLPARRNPWTIRRRPRRDGPVPGSSPPRPSPLSRSSAGPGPSPSRSSLRCVSPSRDRSSWRGSGWRSWPPSRCSTSSTSTGTGHRPASDGS
ncbi:MAG: hypothetical protein R2705_22435 [Ilumatobacteraceae bacterium]